MGQTMPKTTMTDLDTQIKSADVVFFDQPDLTLLPASETALKQHSIEFKLVAIDPNYRSLLKSKTGKSSAPSVWIKGESSAAAMAVPSRGTACYRCSQMANSSRCLPLHEPRRAAGSR